jgi:hypothetical protein
MVRGSSLRITELKANGGLEDEIRYGVSKSVTKVTINEVTDPGNRELVRNDEDEPRLHLWQADQMIQYKSDIEFIRCDPGVLSLVAGVPLALNYNGDVAGFDANTHLPAKAFALEVWSRLVGRNCEPGEREYGYTVLPYLKGGVLSGFKFDQGLVSFSLRRAQTKRSNKWNVGPYDLTGPYERLLTPLGTNLMFRQFITTAAPPEQTDGIQSFADVIDGGTAAVTTDDILDGEFVVTSPYSVEGGYAI